MKVRAYRHNPRSAPSGAVLDLPDAEGNLWIRRGYGLYLGPSDPTPAMEIEPEPEAEPEPEPDLVTNPSETSPKWGFGTIASSEEDQE